MTLQIGSIVRPVIGPHKNEAHEVIHIFEDGHANIRLVEGESEYKSGHVTSHPNFLEEEMLNEEYQDPVGSWFHSMSDKAKQSYRKNHPDSQGSFGYQPGSTKHHRALSISHANYAQLHRDEMNKHEDKRMDSTNSDDRSRHTHLKREHGEMYYHHNMKAAHHDAIASGAIPPLHETHPARNY